MNSSLSSLMLIAFDNHASKADRILQNYVISSESFDPDKFCYDIKNKFLDGIHIAIVETTIKVLTRDLKTQQRVAEALGLKDRTSISQMLRSGSIDGVRLTAAFYQFPYLIEYMPKKELLTLFGFARAISSIKAIAYNNKSIEGAMSPQECSYLIGVMANNEWTTAIRNSDPFVARNIATQIIQERTIIATTSPPKVDNRRPEQYVLMLQELWVTWKDFAIIALWAIPECIPEINNGERVA
jgi:hypothetical protein